MVKITWLGEDTEDIPGPSFNIWNGVKFPKGVAVDIDAAEITNEIRQHMIHKAKAGGRFYKVSETKEATHDEEEKEEKQIEEQDLADPEIRQAYRRQTPTGYSPKKIKKKPEQKTRTPAGADADARPSDDAA